MCSIDFHLILIINGFEGVFKYLIFENLTLLACQLPLPSFHQCGIEKRSLNGKRQEDSEEKFECEN